MVRSKEALKAYIGIKRTNDRFTTAAKQHVAHYDLNLNEFAVLELLFHKGEQTVQTIKEKILIANSSTTYIIDKLSDKGLVKRVVSSDDRRIFFIHLTEKGEALISQIFPEHEKIIENLYQRLTDEEIIDLKELLKKLNHK
ncbi:MAG: MarR family transcriptional regulator [Clostridiaceae bacterium]|nr:MarR family transcriptional regulator [Clostridiaceae bacterium]